jgi:hypothetical protein
MDVSLWTVSENRWAVCDGPGPDGIKGYVTFRDHEYWAEGQPAGNLTLETAAGRIIGRPLEPGRELIDYIIQRGDETRTVRT